MLDNIWKGWGKPVSVQQSILKALSNGKKQVIQHSEQMLILFTQNQTNPNESKLRN